MDFTLSEEHEAIRDAIRSFAQRELAPVAREIDEEERFPLDVYGRLAQQGFLGAAFPEDLGGGGGDLLANAIIKEELSAVSPGFAMSCGVSAIFFAFNILELGTRAQHERWIPPVLGGEKIGAWCLTEPDSGSDALSVRTRSRRTDDGYVIDGTKTFVTNGPIADWFLVVTRTSGEGINGGTIFVLDRDMPGLQIGKPFEKLGMRCSPTSEVVFDGVVATSDRVVGGEGEGFRGMMGALDTERVTAPFTSIGIARACFERSRAYALEREQFGKPIAHFQLIKAKLADMATDIALARTYALKVVWMKMQGMPVTFEVAMAKRFAARMALRAAEQAIQIHGGYGFMREYDVERFFRDVKITDIGGGTTEIQTLIAARELLKGLDP